MQKNALKLVTVYFVLEKDNIDCFKSFKMNFMVSLKCFQAMMVNICIVNRWFTVIYRRVIHSNGHLTLNGFISWHGSMTTVIIL